MRIDRSMSAGNKRTLLLSLVVTAVLSLIPISSHATIFWTDEWEAGNSGYGLPAGFSYDTNIKVSGNGSVRLDYPPICEPATFGGTGCGGFTDRGFPATSTLYRRIYFRMSPGFATSIDTFTKMFRSDTTGPTSNWWMMGQGNGVVGGKQWIVGDQNVPIGETATRWSSFIFRDATWYCLETMEQLNTPGVANGLQRAWVDGRLVMDLNNVPYRAAGDNSLYVNNRMYRQTGVGSIWYDSLAVGNSRIGCLGSVPAGDSTPPAPPVGLFAR